MEIKIETTLLKKPGPSLEETMPPLIRKADQENNSSLTGAIREVRTEALAQSLGA